MKGLMISVILAFAFSMIAAPPVTGDTIYLKNGLKFKAYVLDQTADKITFTRYGGMVSISMNQVEKIEKDNFGGIDEEKAKETAAETERQKAGEAAQPQEMQDRTSAGYSDTARDTTGRMTARDEDQEQEESSTKAYWQNLKKDLESKIEAKKGQLDRLARYRRGLSRNFINTSEIRKEIDEVQKELDDLEAEYRELPEKARKEGVPPGWLR